MSSYRTLDASLAITEDVRGAVYPFRRAKSTTPAKTGPPDACTGEEAYKHLRKSAPANIPLPRTLKWAEEVPTEVRPVVLLRQFPRIANLIVAAWDDLLQFEIYMESLLTDKRGGRNGFPTEIITELASLNIYRHTVQARALPAIAWSEVGPRR